MGEVLTDLNPSNVRDRKM